MVRGLFLREKVSLGFMGIECDVIHRNEKDQHHKYTLFRMKTIEPEFDTNRVTHNLRH